MAIANGTCVSFCNQPKAHFGLPWVRPWDNHGLKERSTAPFLTVLLKGKFDCIILAYICVYFVVEGVSISITRAYSTGGT